MLTGDGTSSRVATGEVVATAPGLVLYRTCDDELRCEHRSRVLADWSEVEVSLPGGGGRAYLAPRGPVVFVERSDTTGGTVLDVVTTGGSELGVITRVDTPPGLSRSALDRLAWSPDGQFAAIPLDDALLLVSAGGAATLVPLPDGLPVELVAVLSPG